MRKRKHLTMCLYQWALFAVTNDCLENWVNEQRDRIASGDPYELDAYREHYQNLADESRGYPGYEMSYRIQQGLAWLYAIALETP